MTMELECLIGDIGDGLWYWSVWVGGESLETVEEVIYTLDRSFSQPVRRIRDRATKFKIQDIASTSFTVYSRIRLRDGSDVRIQKHLQPENHGTDRSTPSKAAKHPKPIILTIDDDSSVLAAIGMDLRRQYGGAFRVLLANSGENGLRNLREIRTRGDEVALILSDQRMPGMVGVEFLEKVQSLYPSAKRALLTAYADTEAAIRAINWAKVDYYITKPWDPPEECLYPILDKLLGDWQPSRAARFTNSPSS